MYLLSIFRAHEYINDISFDSLEESYEFFDYYCDTDLDWTVTLYRRTDLSTVVAMIRRYGRNSNASL